MKKSDLQTALKQAMKEKDKLRLDTIRGVLSAIQYEEMEKKVDELSSDALISVLQRELKRRREELEFAQQAGRADLLEKFNAEISVLEAFLPQQLSQAEIEKIVTDLKSSSPNLNLGVAMKHLKDQYSGQYDSKMASDVCRKMLG